MSKYFCRLDVYFASFMQKDFRKNLIDLYTAIKKDSSEDDKLVSLCMSTNYH